MIGVEYLSCKTKSGNTVAFVPGTTTEMRRIVVITPEKVIIRGCLGEAALAYWTKITSDGKKITGVNDKTFQQLLRGCTIWEKIREKLPGQIPADDDPVLWTLIDDMIIEDKGNACGARHTFFRVTKLHDDADLRGRLDFVKGQFELGLIFLHILSAGKLRTIMRIWEKGKEGSLPPKEYIQRLIANLQ